MIVASNDCSRSVSRYFSMTRRSDSVADALLGADKIGLSVYKVKRASIGFFYSTELFALTSLNHTDRLIYAPRLIGQQSITFLK
jgi:hypothetical protein